MKFFKHDTAMVHEQAKVGDDTRIWAHVNVQQGAVIGSGCNICDGSFVEKGAVIGNHVTVKHNVSIFSGVTIEDDCFIGSNIAFINDRYPRSGNKEWTLEKTFIRRGATLGSNAVVMCGLEVGAYAFVGAGSVVLKDVPAYALVVGNPGKVIGYVCKCAGRLDDKLKCAKCGQQYHKTKQGISPQ